VVALPGPIVVEAVVALPGPIVQAVVELHGPIVAPHGRIMVAHGSTAGSRFYRGQGSGESS